jgi:hypothetical protein
MASSFIDTDDKTAAGQLRMSLREFTGKSVVECDNRSHSAFCPTTVLFSALLGIPAF